MPIHIQPYPLSPNYQLLPQKVDLWRIHLNNQTKSAYEYLNHSEQKRADRFQFAHHQRRFINARAALKQILARYLNTEAKTLDIQNHAFGKPYLNNPYQLEFNLSHSQDRAILAIGQAEPLGVDIECMSRRPYHGIAAHLFSKEEQQALLSCAPHELAFKFFTIWTQKEAFIKTRGLGLRYPTQNFTVPPKAAHQSLIFDTEAQKPQQMISFMYGIAIPAALCCATDIKIINLYDFNSDLQKQER